ncbi:MAG: DoxX family protein [Propionibacteriales bacterium]|nr:DoxX family protein [Propionibacteriales bacterium]
MTVLRSAARPMLASMFVFGGINALRNAPAMAPKAQSFADTVGPLIHKVAPQLPIPTDATSLVRINGLVHVAVGAALATGRFPRLAALILAGTLVPTTLVGHQFWNESDPQSRKNQQVHFFKNVSMAGGLLMASLDPDPGKKILPRRIKDRAAEAIDDLRS